MFKTLTAALVAASVLIAPLASTAQAAQPAAKASAATTKVVKVKVHKRHFARHHHRAKAAHVRHLKKDIVIYNGKVLGKTTKHKRHRAMTRTVKLRTVR